MKYSEVMRLIEEQITEAKHLVNARGVNDPFARIKLDKARYNIEFLQELDFIKKSTMHAMLEDLFSFMKKKEVSK